MTEDRYARIRPLIGRALHEKRVTLVGLGRMGLPVVIQMVRHGVGTDEEGRLRLIDFDEVEEPNLIGTDYLLEHVGMPKVHAATDMIQRINPDTNVSAWNCRLTAEHIPQMQELAQQSDLLCLFADDFDVMIQIAADCYSICPIVAARFGERCDFAETAFSLPNVTPSLPRIFGRSRARAIEGAAALGTDTAFVANFVASLCLRLLLPKGQRGVGLFDCYEDAPLYVIGLRRAWLFENQPPDLVRSIFVVGAPTPVSSNP